MGFIIIKIKLSRKNFEFEINANKRSVIAYKSCIHLYIISAYEDSIVLCKKNKYIAVSLHIKKINEYLL